MKTQTVILGLALTACDGGAGEYVKKQEEFAEKTCACKDVECQSKLQQEQADWLSKNADKAAKLDDKDAEKITAAQTKMAECVSKMATEAASKAMGGG